MHEPKESLLQILAGVEGELCSSTDSSSSDVQDLHMCNKHQVDVEQRSQGLRQALQGSGGCSPWEQQWGSLVALPRSLKVLVEPGATVGC